MLGPVAVWIEIKAPGAKGRPNQLREHTRMREHGQLVFVADSIETVDAILDAMDVSEVPA